MTGITDEQVEAALNAYRKHEKGTEYAGILCKCDVYCGSEGEFKAHRMRAALEAAAAVTGDTSDGYHTFNELYEYRMLYNAHAAHGWLAAGIPVVKSWKHSDGEDCFGGGWFIVTAQLPSGQVSNHYEAAHWELFKVPAVDVAPEWDGHTPKDAAERLRAATPAPVVDVEKLVVEARAEGWDACKSEVFATPCWFNTETQTGGFDFGDDEDGNAVETGAFMHLRTVLGVNPYLNGGASTPNRVQLHRPDGSPKTNDEIRAEAQQMNGGAK